MQILAQLLVSGVAVGMIYGVIAFGYQLTFATSKTLNFGQGEALMLGALVGLILGVTENLTGYYLSTGYKDVPGLVLLLLVLSFKPSGLFGKKTIKKV